MKKIITNPEKNSHSFFEKALKTELIWSFVGNLTVIFLTGAFEDKDDLEKNELAMGFYYYTEKCK